MIVLTRTLGAHSTARVVARWCRPALEAAYAAAPGDGRQPLTLPIMTMLPPDSCSCMTALPRWATCRADIKLRSSTFELNDGLAVAAGRDGPPPALLITVSSRPKRSTV